jgi:hypothetical protein
MAIKQTRQLGHEEHAVTGLAVRVEMTGPDFAITLAQYTSRNSGYLTSR